MLNREFGNQKHADHCRELSEMLDKAVNAANTVFDWCSARDAGMEFLMHRLQLRHLTEFGDGLSVLISKSVSEPCKPLLRGMFESVLAIEYMFGDPTRQRAACLFVAYLNAQKRLLCMYDPATPFGREHKGIVDRENRFPPEAMPGEDTAKQRKQIDAMLANAALAEAVKAFEPVPVKSDCPNADCKRPLPKPKKPKNWYSAFDGPPNAAELATRLKRRHEYNVVYGWLSDTVHGTHAAHAIQARAGKTPLYLPLRDPTNVKTFATYGVTWLHRASQLMIKNLAPEKADDYRAMYATFREVFLRGSKLKVSYDPQPGPDDPGLGSGPSAPPPTA